MSASGLVQLVISTAVFLLAGVAAKVWAITPGLWQLLLVLLLYSVGNLIMLRLIRDSV